MYRAAYVAVVPLVFLVGCSQRSTAVVAQSAESAKPVPAPEIALAGAAESSIRSSEPSESLKVVPQSASFNAALMTTPATDSWTDALSHRPDWGPLPPNYVVISDRPTGRTSLIAPPVADFVKPEDKDRLRPWMTGTNPTLVPNRPQLDLKSDGKRLSPFRYRDQIDW